jgi:hypothetical protein
MSHPVNLQSHFLNLNSKLIWLHNGNEVGKYKKKAEWEHLKA